MKEESIPVELDQAADKEKEISNRLVRQLQIRRCYKARLVAKGFEQKFTFGLCSPLSLAILRVLMALAAYFGIFTCCMLDIATAFLNADLVKSI